MTDPLMEQAAVDSQNELLRSIDEEFILENFESNLKLSADENMEEIKVDQNIKPDDGRKI